MDSFGVNGIWKAQADQKNQVFKNLFNDFVQKSNTDSKSGFSLISPHLSHDTVSGMVEGFAKEHNISQSGEISSSVLTDEQKMILTEATSSLYTRDVYSKLVSQLQDQSRNYQLTHITKL